MQVSRLWQSVLFKFTFSFIVSKLLKLMKKSVRTSFRLAYGLFRNMLSHSESSLSLFQISETRRDLLETEPMVRRCSHDHSSGSYSAGQSRLGGYHQHLAPYLLIFPLGIEHTELQEDMTHSTRKTRPSHLTIVLRGTRSVTMAVLCTGQ